MQEDSIAFDDARRLDEYLLKSTRASFRRAAVFATARSHVESPDASSKSAALDTIDALSEAESSARELSSQTAGLTNAISVPATPVLVGFAPATLETPVDESFDVELSITNAGDEPTGRLRLELSADGELDVDETERTVEPIAGRTATTLEVTGEADESGIATLSAVMESSARGSQRTEATVWAGESPDLAHDSSSATGVRERAADALPDDSTEWAGVGLAGLATYSYLSGDAETEIPDEGDGGGGE